jgi:pyruvate/2-oxoglutarate dehydrogenase complex dihydrolipoamide acyltransferase (E2) component
MSEEINPLRAMMVQNIINQNSSEPITVENLAPFFPKDFDLGEDDLENYRQSRPVIFEGEPEAMPAATQEAAPEAVAEPEAPPPATPDAIEAATVRRIAADQSLANARVAVTVAGNVERAARDKLAKAVSAFQSGFAPITREMLMRDVIASEQARKAAGHVTQRQGRPGNSVVDQSAFYGRGGNPARYAPAPWGLNGKPVPAGTPGAVPGAKGYRRGAFSSQEKGARNDNPARGPVAALPKVPSEI